jgi:hypothetical protein
MNLKFRQVREPNCMIYCNVNYELYKLQDDIFQISNNKNVNPRVKKNKNYYRYKYK